MPAAVLKIVRSHALASKDKVGSLRRWAVLRLRQSLSDDAQIVTYGEGARLHVERRATVAELNHICGLQDYSEMMLLLHVTRPGELVLDIGANVGTYSVLAAYCAKASVIAVEPAPRTLKRLEQNLELNGIAHQVRVVPCCVSATPGRVQFSANHDAINHVATAGDPAEGKLSVDAVTIDQLCADVTPILIKIDIEGYELPALRGAEETLTDPRLKVVLVEMNASGHRYGFDDRELDELLSAAGFSTYAYHPTSRTLAPVTGSVTANRIYVRDIDWVRERVRSARRFKIHNLAL